MRCGQCGGEQLDLGRMRMAHSAKTGKSGAGGASSSPRASTAKAIAAAKPSSPSKSASKSASKTAGKSSGKTSARPESRAAVPNRPAGATPQRGTDAAAAATRSRGKPAASLEAECIALRDQLADAKAEIARLKKREELVVNRIDWVIDSLHNLLEEEG